VLVPTARIPLYLLLVTALVTSLDMLTHAALYDLHETLGLFIPLIVVNCGLLAHAETVASRRPVVFVAASALATGFGFMFALIALGALREVLGHGTLLAGTGLLRGESGAETGLELPFDGMLVAILPPGAFFGMGLMLALRNRLLATRAAKAQAGLPALPEAPR
jgi:electron transport complex protein RnfE